MLRLRTAAVALVSACSTEPPHANPFDPASPPSAQAKATLAGSFTLEGSSPPSGIHVSLLGTGLSADTAADGTYRIAGVSPGTYSVQGSKDGYRNALVAGVVVRLEDGDRTVSAPAAQLERARGSIAGIVRLEGESFHGGTTVSAAGLDGSAVTDAAGKFVLDRVPAGTWTLTASRFGFDDEVVAGVQVSDQRVTAIADVTLAARPGTIAGEVTLEGRTDFSDVTISAAGATLAGATAGASGRSDMEGKFAIGPLPAGTYSITAVASGYVTQTAAATISPAATTSLPPMALLRQRGSVAGTATLGGAATSAGIAVTLLQNSTAIASAQTSPAGVWRMDGVPVGAYSIVYEKVGYEVASGSATVVAQDVVQALAVVLAPLPSSLHGTVLLEGGGDPAGTLVAVEGTTLSTHVVADGSWSLSGSIQGTRTVAIERAGYERQRVQVTVGPGETMPVLPVTLALSRGAISGVVLLKDAASSAGVVVSLRGTSFSTVTDASGAFGISGVPIGTYSVAAAKPPDWQEASVAGIGVTRNGTTVLPGSPVVLQAVATASISGTTLVEGGDAAGTTVSLLGQDFRGLAVTATTTTGAAGGWSFTGLVAGTYQVSFVRGGSESPAPLSVSASSGQAVDLGTATLALSRGAIAGSFQLAGTTSSAGVVVSLQGTSFSTVTDAAGAFGFSAVPVGTYTLSAANPPDWQVTTVPSVIVIRNATASMPGSPVAMQPVSTASISGAAMLELQPDASGTTVTLTGQDFRGVGVTLSTTTGQSGAWSFDSLRAGSYQVVLTHSAFEPAPANGVSVVTGQAASVGTVTLAASRGSVTGTATAAGAVNQAGTVVTVSGGPDTASTVSDGTGRFRIDRLRVSAGYVATFSRAAYTAGVSPAFEISSGATTSLSSITLQLATDGTISGSAAVERPAGANGGIAVSLTGSDLNGAPVTRSTTTAATGAYSLSALPVGTYALSFGKAGYDPEQLSGISVSSGAVTSAAAVTLRVAAGDIAGTVALLAGSISGFQVGTDFSGVVVTLTGTDVPVPAAITDAVGSYRFTGVPVSLSGAQFTVTASKPYFSSASTSVTAAANATVTVSQTLTLAVDAATLTGTARLFDNVGGMGANPSSAGISISATGTAFNGNAFTASASTGASGAWSIGPLPPGSYQAVATSTNRTCGAYRTTTVPPGSTAGTGSVDCMDTIAPGPVVLGSPTPSSGAQPGYTSATTAVVPIVTQAADATSPASNFRGYQIALGAAPDWPSATPVAGQAASLSLSGLPRNTRTLLSARAVDWVGNAGPTATVEIVQDDIPPPVPQLSTPRAIVNATTTSVTASGSEADANFLRYEQCTASVSAVSDCPATPGCTFAATAPTFAASLTADQKACIYVRAVDLAGNRSAAALTAVTSDLTPPSVVQFAPSYDPSTVSVRAPWVDFFSSAAATDSPGTGAPWSGISHIEVDSGAGFSAVCPQSACHLAGVYAPCGCACTDPRLLCDGATFVGVRATLTAGTSTNVSFRAIDLAGNVGPGISQQVLSEVTSEIIASTSANEGNVIARGSLVGWTASDSNGAHLMLTDLGSDRRVDDSDRRCELGISVGVAEPSVTPAHAALVAYDRNGSASILRPGPDGVWCTADDVSKTVLTPPASSFIVAITAAGETMAVTVHSGSVDSLFALEPGIDGLLATADDPAPVTLLTGPFIGQLAMGRGAILFETQACSSCAFVWNVISAGPGGSFQTGTTSIVLPNSSNAAISADGSAVAWASPGSGSVLSVRTTGPNGRFDASDDVVITRPMPANLVPGMMAIDGTRLVVLGRDSSTNTDWIVRWDAGADGIWGTADDVIERSHGSPGLRVQPSLSSGLLAFVQNGDVLAFDLSTLRWESAPAGGAQFLASNGAGTLFWTENGRMKARSPSGIERAGPFVSSSGFRMFDAAAADLVAIDPNTLGVSAYNPDASGLYFTASAPSGKIYSTTNSILSVGTGGGKAIVKEISSASTRFYRIIEPRGGALRDAATLGRVVNAGSDTCANCTNSLAITSRQALVSCDNAYLCVYNAGIDGEFGTADDPPPVHLNHATGSPAAGRAINPYRFRASSSTLAFVEAVGPGPTFYVLSAGPDGVFGTSDDREALVENFLNGYDHFSVVGDRVAFPLNGAPGGDQVLVLNGVGGSLVTVTHHYSVKTSTALDLSGRVYWIDSAFAPAGIFSYIP